MTNALEVNGHQPRVLKARLGLPHAGVLIPRDRLRALAGPVSEGGILALVAGPGCGKTALIADLLSVYDGPSAYLALQKEDQDPIHLLAYLAAGFGLRPLDHVALDDLFVSAGSDPRWSGANVTSLAEDLAATLRETRGDRALLAIDDLHHVDDSPGSVLALDLLIRLLPPTWTVILSSRRSVPVKLDRLALGGKLVEVGQRVLRFTPNEVGQWAIRNRGVLLDEEQRRTVWRVTLGWPACLVLMSPALFCSGGPATPVDAGRVMGKSRTLKAYIEKDVVGELGEPSALVLLIAGLLPEARLPRDEDVFPLGPDVTAAALEELASAGTLVARRGRLGYVVHPVLRAFAERELPQRDTSGVLVALIAAHLHEIGEHCQAAHLFLRIGLLDRASIAARSLILSSLDSSASLDREAWSDLVPAEAAASEDPWFSMCRARASQAQADYAEAAALYERAARMLSAEGDRRGLLLALLDSAFCLNLLGRWEESLAVLKRSYAVAQAHEEKAEVLVAQGHVLISLCRWDEGVEDWERAMALVQDRQRSPVVQRVHLGRARLFHSLGHYRLARHWAEKAAEDHGGRGAATRLMAVHGASLLASLTGDYQAAAALSDECGRLADAHRMSFLNVPRLLGKAHLDLGRSDYRSSLASCREAQQLALKTGDSEGAYWAEQMLGDLCRCNRNPARALEHHRAAFNMACGNMLGVSEKTRAQAAQGMDLALLGDDAQARAVLEETARLSRQSGLAASLVPSLFYLGWLYAKEGREHEASRSLSESMRLSDEHDHIHFFNHEARVAVPIFGLCERFGVGTFLRDRVVPLLPIRLQDYFRLLADGDVYPTDRPLGPPKGARAASGVVSCGPSPSLPDDGVSARMSLLTEREAEILKAMAGGMPNKVIGARLYISEKTVKTHANHIFRKLGVTNRLQATLLLQSHQRATAAGTAAQHRRR